MEKDRCAVILPVKRNSFSGTPGKGRCHLIVRAYNDGVAFRYIFPEKQGSYLVKEELTAYHIPKEARRWMQQWNPANEGLYKLMSGSKIEKQEWCYPALFQTTDSACWYLLHEADLNGTYCGSKLSNTIDASTYRIAFPDPKDVERAGKKYTFHIPSPAITLAGDHHGQPAGYCCFHIGG